MTITFGRSFIVEIAHGGIFIRLPQIGQFSAGGGLPLAWDGWRALRATGEV